jgi:hypothetical protein
MPASSVRRRLATVLFLDIVGSTALATSLGDARWRELLTRFRRVVRAELKRHGGREQDTAGDGFFATFSEPAPALEAAAAIVHAVQQLGVDVRCGVHTGECELIDGKLGGIAVHIGSRVMALAGPAEVLVTGTVKDLVAGSGARFEDRGTHELKGVEGAWHVDALKAVETPLPAPLSAELAAERLELVRPSGKRPRRRAALVAVACVVIAAVLVPLLAVGGGSARAAPTTLVGIDPSTGRLATILRDGPIGCPCGENLWAVSGTLWQRIGAEGTALALRNVQTGKRERTLPLERGTVDFAIGFGSVWELRHSVIVSGPNAGSFIQAVDRIDELSGRRIARIPLEGDTARGSVAVGNGAVWALRSDGTLDRVDPATSRVTTSYRTGALETTILVPVDGYEWICECFLHQVLRFDPRTRTSKTFTFASLPFHLISVEGRSGRTLWLLDEQDATLTQINGRTGRASQTLGLSGQPSQAVVGFGSIWVAAGTVVDRVSLATGNRTTITMPKGVYAGGIATDAATHTVWADNSLRPVATP